MTTPTKEGQECVITGGSSTGLNVVVVSFKECTANSPMVEVRYKDEHGVTRYGYEFLDRLECENMKETVRCPRCGREQTITAYCVDARSTPSYADKYGCARYESVPAKITIEALGVRE